MEDGRVMAADDARQRKPYHSPRRAEQAIATRRAVLDAARELFIEQGYAVTTVADIARRARVAVDTVYAAVGRKPALLREVLETAISGSDQAVPAEQRDYVARVRDAKGAREKIETYVAALADIQPRLAPVYLALRDAAATDPDSAATWGEISERRARNMRAFAADLRATGELRTDLSDDAIADIVWSMNGPEYWTLLVSDRGWSAEQFGHHLTDAWQRLFLADPGLTGRDRRSNAVGGVKENLLERAGQVAVPHHGRRGRQRVIFETDQDHVVVDHGPWQPDQPGLASGNDAGAGQHGGGPVRGRGEGQSHRQRMPHGGTGEFEARIHRAQHPRPGVINSGVQAARPVDDDHPGQLAQADRPAARRRVRRGDPHIGLELPQAHDLERGGQCLDAVRQPAQASVGPALRDQREPGVQRGLHPGDLYASASPAP